MTLELHATPQEVMRAVEALREFGETHRVPERTLFGLMLALEESASNIVNHSLKRDPARRFHVAINHTGVAVVLELRDPGAAFDPTQAQPASSNASQEERPAGGWGLELVRHYMDEVEYTRSGQENFLRLTKLLPSETGTKTLPISN